MSQKMKDLLLEGNAEISRGNHEGFLKHCTEDTEWNFLGDRMLKGKEAVRQWMKETYIQPPKVVVDHLISEGEFLVAMGKVTVVNKSGKEETNSYCDVWEFRDGKLAKLKAFVV